MEQFILKNLMKQPVVVNHISCSHLLTRESWLAAHKGQGDSLVPVHHSGEEGGGVSPANGCYIPGPNNAILFYMLANPLPT